MKLKHQTVASRRK